MKKKLFLITLACIFTALCIFLITARVGLLDPLYNLESRTIISDYSQSDKEWKYVESTTRGIYVPHYMKPLKFDATRHVYHKPILELSEPNFSRVYIRYPADLNEVDFVDFFKSIGWLEDVDFSELNYRDNAIYGGMKFHHPPEWLPATQLAELDLSLYLDQQGNLYFYSERYAEGLWRPIEKWGK